MPDEIVAALAQRLPQQDGGLREVDGVLRASSPELPRQHGIRRQLAHLSPTCFLRPLIETFQRPAGTMPRRNSRLIDPWLALERQRQTKMYCYATNATIKEPQIVSRMFETA